jgi:hypothetical protein
MKNIPKPEKVDLMKILTEESPNNDDQFLSELPLKRKSNKFKNKKSSINDIMVP